MFVNGAAAKKPSQPVRVGDSVVLRQGRRNCAVLVLALGTRRGPASEARLLYEEAVPPAAAPAAAADWTPLLIDEFPGETSGASC